MREQRASLGRQRFGAGQEATSVLGGEDERDPSRGVAARPLANRRTIELALDDEPVEKLVDSTEKMIVASGACPRPRGQIGIDVSGRDGAEAANPTLVNKSIE